LAAGFAAGLVIRRTPARGLRWSPLGFACGLATGLVVGFVVWLQVGPGGGLVVGAAATFSGSIGGGLINAVPTDLTRATTPRTVLASDRSTFLACLLGLGLTLGLSTGLAVAFTPSSDPGMQNTPATALAVGITNLVAVGLAFAFLQASWGSFTLARWWLASSGHLPWRLMSFLHDAHQNRGVLRQIGPSYEFRHIELQRRLSATAGTAGATIVESRNSGRVLPVETSG
jgi:hypothetical protein